VLSNVPGSAVEPSVVQALKDVLRLSNNDEYKQMKTSRDLLMQWTDETMDVPDNRRSGSTTM